MRFLHFLRFFWANIFGLACDIVWIFKIVFNAEIRERYKDNLATYEEVFTMADLVNFFFSRYRYKWDGPKGLFDHNNYKHEFFSTFGDCDDVARWSHKKLKEFGYKCCVVGFADLSAEPKFWHYDCMFTVSDIAFLFNYGKCITLKGYDTKSAAAAMSEIYGKNYKWNKGIKAWECRIM